MDDTLAKVLASLMRKTEGESFDASVKFEFVEVGALRLDEQGARVDDGTEADCVITADLDTFRALFDGELGPTAAFMTGRIRISGDMGVAMKAASLLG